MSQIHDRFQTTIAGSLPKPAWLAEPNKLWPAWRASGAELERAKRDATLLWLKEQEDVGIDIVTEGEQSRQHFVHGFLEFVDGIDFSRKVKMGIRNNRYDAMVPVVGGPLRLKGRVHEVEARLARGHTGRKLKITLPGPMTIVDTIADEFYRDKVKLALVFAELLNQEARALEKDGVDVIHVASDRVESPEEVAETIGRALQYVPAKHLFPCTNCGMAPMDRDVALAKLKALAEGAALARKKLRNRGQSPISGGKRGLSLFSTRRRRRRGSTRTSSRAGRSQPRAAASPRRAARRK